MTCVTILLYCDNYWASIGTMYSVFDQIDKMFGFGDLKGT